LFQSTPKPSAAVPPATKAPPSLEDRRRLEEAVLCSLADDNPPSPPDNLPVADTPTVSASTPTPPVISVESADVPESSSMGDSRPVSRMSDEALPPPPQLPGDVVVPSATQPIDDPFRDLGGNDDESRPTSAAAAATEERPVSVPPVVLVDLTTSLTDPPTPLNDEKPSPGIESAATPSLPSRAVIYIAR